ncbi:MAG: hypothetical protein C4330_07650 [Chitinophagaceae bacterium]
MYITTSKTENASLHLVDMNGKIMMTRTIAVHEGRNAINLSNLAGFARGNYIMKIATSNGLYYQKLMLQ